MTKGHHVTYPPHIVRGVLRNFSYGGGFGLIFALLWSFSYNNDKSKRAKYYASLPSETAA